MIPKRAIVVSGTFLLAVLLYVDRICISTAKDGITHDLGLTDKQFGWVLSSFALGAGIMAFELPTAFPYFAAIATIAASRTSIVVQLGLVGLYNLLFVLPLLGILAARTLAGARGESVLQSMRGWVQRNAPAVFSATLATIGLASLAVGLAGLA